MTDVTRNNHRYLGDGVYASDDGYQIWLTINSHNSEPLIALDHATFRALVQYGNKFYGEEDSK